MDYCEYITKNRLLLHIFSVTKIYSKTFQKVQKKNEIFRNLYKKNHLIPNLKTFF